MSNNGIPENALSKFVGVSATETPKYLIMNNFLLRYFKSNNNFKFQSIINWENDLFLCEESNEKIKEQLKNSFSHYFTAYTGKSLMSKKIKPLFFPIIPEMLSTNEQYGLRHLLYALQTKSVNNSNEYVVIQKKLFDFVFKDNNTELYAILKFICNNDETENDIKFYDYEEKNEFGENYNKKFFIKLSHKFNDDLIKILNNQELLNMDFYKRIDFFSTFLVFYVIQYLVERTNETDLNKKNIIFCKGSISPSLQVGPLHKACLNSYSSIRERFPEIVKQQFVKSINQFGANKFKICSNDPITITAIWNSENKPEKNYELITFLKEAGLITARTSEQKLKEIFIEVFFGKDFTEKREDCIDETKESFIIKYFNVQKRMKGSNTAKVSGMLPAIGKEINFIYPRSSARQKYFVISEDMAEFLVRLYFSTKDDLYYDYLDNFILWLKIRYNIYITLDETLKSYLQRIGSGISVIESNQNEKAFIQNLININSLIKLSDSGYLLILPERKGDFKLL